MNPSTNSKAQATDAGNDASGSNHRQEGVEQGQGDVPPGPDAWNILRPITLRAALDAAKKWSPTWLAKGLWLSGSHGQLAGPAKSAKSYIGLAITVGVAAGLSVLGEFEVPTPGTVLVYVGEGGVNPFLVRLERMAEAHGVPAAQIGDLPIHLVTGIAPLNSQAFQQKLKESLDQLRPDLVWIDPLYSYFERSIRTQDLFDMGPFLNTISVPCGEAGATLIVNNHFNQTGSGKGLHRITQAGSAEQSDSWVLVNHRHAFQADTGTFQLHLQVGSRQWGGREYDLDLSEGVLDPDAMDFDGPITWQVVQAGCSKAAPREGSDAAERVRVEKAKCKIEDVIATDGHMSKTEIKDKVKGDKDVFQAAFREMERDGVIVPTEVPTATRKRTEWSLAANRGRRAEP